MYVEYVIAIRPLRLELPTRSAMTIISNRAVLRCIFQNVCASAVPKILRTLKHRVLVSSCQSWGIETAQSWNSCAN